MISGFKVLTGMRACADRHLGTRNKNEKEARQGGF